MMTSLVLFKSVGETREAFHGTYTRLPVMNFIIKQFQKKTVFASLCQSLQFSVACGSYGKRGDMDGFS